MHENEYTPYVPRSGGRSILTGIGGDWASIFETRAERLARPIRAFTLNWLAWSVALACQRPVSIAREALTNAIPDGHERVLDGGGDFIFIVDEAAVALGGDPASVVLRPQRLHS